MDLEDPSITQKLWGMTPVGAFWTESMQLGGLMHTSACEDFNRELESKNLVLSHELTMARLRASVLEEDLQRTNAMLGEAQVELALLRREREEMEEQDRLARNIWGPVMRSKPDATWDPPPVLLFHQPKEAGAGLGQDLPLSIGRVAGELGFDTTGQEVHRLGLLVRLQYVRANGKPPELKVYYNKDGAPERISCFTERDRELITTVVRQYGMPC
jgi:hypothetical protein